MSGDEITAGNIDKGAAVALGQDARAEVKNIEHYYEAAAPIALNLHQLPPPLRDFTGRVTELAELMAALEKGGVTISGLQGLGGVGKTALALVLAERLTPRYPDAQFYLDLKGVSDRPLSPADAMAHVVRAYHPTSKLPDGETELSALYQTVLHGQRALLLMDNAKDAVQVTPLIPPTGCVLLVTSRQHFALPGLFAKNLDALPPDDARDLLLKIAPRLALSPLPSPKLGEGLGVGANAADQIARLCGYLPLALRLAGSALAERVDLSPADYLRRLQNAQTRFPEVDASLALSYELLSEELQRLWRTLAVFPDTFDRDAALAVWGVAQEDETARDAAHEQLSELVKYSMVEYGAAALPHPGSLPQGEGALTDRYRLHDLARLFADRKLSDGERDNGRRRHAEHFRLVFQAINESVHRGGRYNILDGFKGLYLEGQNIDTGMEWVRLHVLRDDTLTRLWNSYDKLLNDLIILLAVADEIDRSQMRLIM